MLAAAEQLWREAGFLQEFIGGSGMATEFDAMMARLARSWLQVRRRTAISDELLSD